MRESGYQAEFGLLGAGTVSVGVIGQWFLKSQKLGPVAGVSLRVASRIANSLRCGTAVRSADELNGAKTIFFHSPEEHLEILLQVLRTAEINWAGRCLIFCDYRIDPAVVQEFQSRGACIASLRPCAIPARLVIEGTAPALTTVKNIARALSAKTIEIEPGSGACFEAAVSLGSSALTPLLHHTADLLRQCGIRDNEAPELAAALFQQTAREYGHSGMQSWAWYIREPAAGDLEAQIKAVGERFHGILRELMLLGLEGFAKHPAVALALRGKSFSVSRECEPEPQG